MFFKTSNRYKLTAFFQSLCFKDVHLRYGGNLYPHSFLQTKMQLLQFSFFYRFESQKSNGGNDWQRIGFEEK